MDAAALSRVIAVVNGKGGVLKTSVSTNVAGLLAADGMRVLLMNLDTQSNANLDLGLADEPADDLGKSVVDAVWYGHDLRIFKDARPGLDYVFGGRGLAMLEQLSSSSMAADLPSGSAPAEFARRLAEVAGEYDVVIIDCPPGKEGLQDCALAAARWVLVPTKTDQGSRDGLLEIGPRVKRARQINPGIDYLGVVITDHGQSASRILAKTRETLDADLGERVPLFSSFIRHSQKVAQDSRDRGQLVHEIARDAAESKAARLAALRARREGEVVDMPETLSDAAHALAGDYRGLARELCERLTAAETAKAGA